jgi:predicted ATP-grasp superfamily ATP-dependent carboligase
VTSVSVIRFAFALAVAAGATAVSDWTSGDYLSACAFTAIAFVAGLNGFVGSDIVARGGRLR